jgi:cytoskeletal protein CcmA (bactofilin family)
MTLIQIIRKLRQHLIAHLRSGSEVLVDQAGRLAFGGKRRREASMAETADDLGIPNKPVRPASRAPEPSKITDGPRPAAKALPVLPPTPDFLRPNAQPASVPPSPRPGPNRLAGPTDNGVEARKLVVGQGVSLSGEINSCDRLIVEGSVQANLQNCQHITVAETGLFDGNAVIDEADVHGRFEGDLMVRRRLLIRANGRVSGTISYGEIEIEEGGKISGTIQATSNR